MRRVFLIIVLHIVAVLGVVAAPIDEQAARQIALDFFARNSTRSASVGVELEWATTQTGQVGRVGKLGMDFADPNIYIYNRTDMDGFVVVAADSSVEPIIGFSFDREFDSYNMAPALQEILSAWSNQIAAMSSEKSAETRSTTIVEEVNYNSALWNQGTPFNDECPLVNGGRSVTGCVATAMSIICYYNKWPLGGTGTAPEYSYSYNNLEVTIPEHKLSSSYNYGTMLHSYNYGYTSTQGAAVASLMHDMGRAVRMQYSPEASGAFSEEVAGVMSKYFGYSKGATYNSRDSYSSIEWFELMRKNLDAYGPTFYSGSGSAGGHAFVIDGYATNDYFSVNFGWGGANNGYFLLPYIEFYYDQGAIWGLTPDKNGTSTYKDNLVLTAMGYVDENGYWVTVYRGLSSLATEYKQNEENAYVVGGIINMGQTDFNGELQVALCDKSGRIKQTLYKDSERRTIPVNGYDYFADYLYLTIQVPIEDGDRIRLLYKGAYSDDWQWARRSDQDAVSELLIAATAEEVSESLSLIYDKQSQTLQLLSNLALRYVLIDESGAEQAIATPSYESVGANVESGSYTLKCYSGSIPYILNLKF